MLLRGITIDSSRGDQQRRQAFERLLTVERGLWINRLGNEEEEEEIEAALSTLRTADFLRFDYDPRDDIDPRDAADPRGQCDSCDDLGSDTGYSRIRCHELQSEECQCEAHGYPGQHYD